ncbi:MAG: hypothetical protein ACTSYA_03770 [Candidatus Kariarchaeaceae archaeon]
MVTSKENEEIDNYPFDSIINETLQLCVLTLVYYSSKSYQNTSA